MNDEQTRAVVLRLSEDRLAVRERTGTDQERIARIAAKSQAVLPEKKRLLENLVLQHHRLTVERASKEIIDSLAVQIQVMDTDILMLERGVVAVATAIAYRYYRQGANSVEIAEELGIKSPMTRVWLYRMNTVANRLGIGDGTRTINKDNRIYNRTAEPGKRSIVRAWPKQKVMALFALRSAGTPMRKCAQVLGEPQHTVVSAWRYYFGSLRTHRTRRHIPVPRSAGLTEFRTRMADRLRALFLLRTTGKTWDESAKALQCSTANLMELWKRHFGDLKVKPRKSKQPKPPKKPRYWTPDKIAQLKTLREVDKLSFGKIAKLMGRSRPQDTYAAYAWHVQGKR